MPKRTRKGVAAVDQIHKFEHFILHASDKEIAAAHEARPRSFLSAFALRPGVLGMGEFWADRFRGHVTLEPQWYTTMEAIEGGSGLRLFRASQKTSSRCLKAVQDMAQNPALRKST